MLLPIAGVSPNNDRSHQARQLMLGLCKEGNEVTKLLVLEVMTGMLVLVVISLIRVAVAVVEKTPGPHRLRRLLCGCAEYV